MFIMKSRSRQLAPCKYILRSFVAILCSLLIAPGDALWARRAIAGAGSGAGAGQAIRRRNSTRWWRRSRFIPMHCSARRWWLPPTLLRSFSFSNGWQSNKNLKDKALTDAAMKQPWDPSVQAMAVLPDMVKVLSENIKWTTDLGNAFLAQQSEVMDAVQRMRGKAKEKGNLKSSEQQKVETKVIESKQVIVIQPANPEVVYVPSYNPTVVYGPPVYPYPPVYYPPPPPPGAYIATAAISFGVGMMVGAAWGGGGWGCGWGGNNDIYYQ